jgi:hypothetical protein
VEFGVKRERNNGERLKKYGNGGSEKKSVKKLKSLENVR